MLRHLHVLVVLATTSAVQAADCPRPISLRFKVIDKIVRSELGFTQGLEWRNGKLYESTGAIGGNSGISVIAPEGTVTNIVDQGTRVFGEGLTILQDEIFQLTWKDHVVHVFDLAGKLKRTMHNPRQGWGLTNDGTSLIFSDGGPSFYFADPQTFTITRQVKVLAHDAAETRGLNELELVDGKLYGNIYRTRTVVRIDPETGCIDARAEMDSLWRASTDDENQQTNAEANVLNGIAYERERGLFYATGKRWRTIFVGRFVEASGSGTGESHETTDAVQDR